MTLGSPRASVLIVASGESALLPRCLEALGAHETSVPFETIVVLNGASSDELSQRRLRHSGEGTRIEGSEVNLGLAGALNLARSLAGGEYVVTLHDDALVQPGWLDALVETADRVPEAGAVGSLVLDEAHSVTAAGCELLPDGRTLPLSAVKAGAVDYCQSCSLLIRAATWDRLGGADERLFRVYYVDVDLCLAIRARGQQVLVEPRSAVVHRAGSSTDRDFARFLLERNRRRMVEKWGDLIANLGGADPPPQERSRDPDERRLGALASHYAVADDYTSDLRSRLAAREQELQELRRRSERLAGIEQGGWWQLHERLLPFLAAVQAARRLIRL
jgi:GT2 family glycosyltransferase